MTVDGIGAAVSFAGRAPGLWEGLDQINILIPSDLPHRHVSVPVKIDGQASGESFPASFGQVSFPYVSNTVMLAIQ